MTGPLQTARMDPTLRPGSLVVAGRRLAFDASQACSGLGFVFLHGLASDRRGEKACAFAEALTAQGHGFAALDVTGHGESDGEIRSLTLSRQIEDATAFLVYLREREGWSGRIALIGSSLGGLTAAWTATLRPDLVSGLVLLAPAFRLVDNELASMGPARAADWERSGATTLVSPWITIHLDWTLVLDWRRHDHASLPMRVHCPTLILHGTADDQVPIGDSRVFAAAASDDIALVEIAGGDHRLTSNLPELVAHVERFARERLAR